MVDHLVKRVDHETKPKLVFSFLAEELRVYILAFLSCRDILCCIFVCKALRQTFISSSELQYIVELSGQCLLPGISNTDDDHAPISERLQLLRDKAHAWFKFNIHSFQTIITSDTHSRERYVSGEHLIYSWNFDSELVTISPIPSKLPQRTIKHNWSLRTLCPLPHAVKFDVLMDPAQNLFAIAYNVCKANYIYLAALDDGHVHPHAAGPVLVMELPETYSMKGELKCYGRHIAMCLWIVHLETWQLQIWDWQHSTKSSSILRLQDRPESDLDSFYFLGNDRLLIVTDNLKLYSIEDMSETPHNAIAVEPLGPCTRSRF
ncbi:hypothetical protein BDR07DRAFT_1393621 [Suillus spraguei]|nr:hypothetical protein BDR07DRAFT_1393621 [Suillus spraguei]